MLQGLFGNKSVERILLFLLVNEKTYATQLHRVLNVPLTPIQKALERLEKEGILTSIYEGKTRFFLFNPLYPLLDELELLLKKAYTLLPPRIKSSFHFVRQVPQETKNHAALIDTIWDRLRNVNKVFFHFRSRTGNNENGKGEVRVVDNQDGHLIFYEKGSWEGKTQEFVFRNAFRWSLNRLDQRIALEHLRFGIHNPVFLFHLIPTKNGYLESAHAHLCGQDTYFGQLICKEKTLILFWRILGPKKNEEMTYTYEPNPIIPLDDL